MRGRHCITLEDFNADEAQQILDTAIDLKQRQKAGETHHLLAGKTLAMIFQKPSNRTRVSFEVGMYQLGGLALNIRPTELEMGKRETIPDISQVMSRYVDGAMLRVMKHTDLNEFARSSHVPCINGLSDLYHPCQALADALTIREHKGKLAGLKVCYVGDGNNVANSLINVCKLLEIDIVISCPKGYEPSVRQSDKNYEIIPDPREAVENADVIYTDVWTSMGQEDERLSRLRDFDGYCVTKELMSRAAKDAIFMHCLPAHRGEEVEQSVVDGPQSVVFDQAENRLHAQKALLSLLL